MLLYLLPLIDSRHLASVQVCACQITYYILYRNLAEVDVAEIRRISLLQ